MSARWWTKRMEMAKGVAKAHVNFILHLRNISRELIVPVQNINEKIQRGSIHPWILLCLYFTMTRFL